MSHLHNLKEEVIKLSDIEALYENILHLSDIFVATGRLSPRDPYGTTVSANPASYFPPPIFNR